jgi:hypothetical protein
MNAFCETDLPADFGKAPSTVQHEATNMNPWLLKLWYLDFDKINHKYIM